MSGVIGSIPACAGAPCQVTQPSMLAGVYPRVCGGTEFEAGDKLQVQGLSPRVRGHQGDHPRRVLQHGSIPACAGAPYLGQGYLCPREVYPRVCGGTSSRPFVKTYRIGLSPRVRGHPRHDVWVVLVDRSIPACAGAPTTAACGGR